jgi:hypothetical protein
MPERNPTVPDNPYFLAKGPHDRPEDGMCAMEWAAYVAGEPHTDQPVCVSPVLRSFCISLNDAWDDDMRQRLRPYLARCIGTAGDGMDRERGFLALDWQIRTYLPAWFRLAGLTEDADRVAALAPIVDLASAKAAAPLVRASCDKAAAAWDAAGAAARAAAGDAARVAAGAAAGDAAWDAAGAAVGDAARVAAGDAAGDAARVAAGVAAGAAAWDAAGDAARDAARVAAGAAARVAAGAAARAALAPTVRELQESALDLLDRMLPKVMVDMPAEVRVRAVEVCGRA